MRMFLIAAAAIASILVPFAARDATAAGETMSQGNPPPSGGSGGHECESKKKEQPTS